MVVSPDSAGAEEILARASDLRWTLPPDTHDSLVAAIYEKAQEIANAAGGSVKAQAKGTFDRTLDRLLTSRWTGVPVMLLILMGVFWLTIAGAYVPSALLATLLLENVYDLLTGFG
ncbi:MAG: ferrous iron transporter B, partial [Gemmatimonadota bacterium]